jgi:hypothetical protein
MTTSAEARRRPDSNGLRISRKSHDWEAPLTRQLTHDRSSCREGNPSEESDVITELQDKRVVVTNADIDADAGGNSVDRLGYVRVFERGHEMAWTPDLDSISGVYRLGLVENSAQGSERRPFFE